MKVWVVLASENDADRFFFWPEEAKVAKVDTEHLAEWFSTGHIDAERSYTIRELLEAVELQN